MAEQRGNRFNRRTRLMGFPGWRGLHLQAYPAAIPQGNFRDTENVRIHLGTITCRGGQEKFAETPLEGFVLGIWPAAFTLP